MSRNSAVTDAEAHDGSEKGDERGTLELSNVTQPRGFSRTYDGFETQTDKMIAKRMEIQMQMAAHEVSLEKFCVCLKLWKNYHKFGNCQGRVFFYTWLM